MDDRICVVFIFILAFCNCTPLDDYVNRPDSTYRYEQIDRVRGASYTTYIMNMTSQTWKTNKVSNSPIWWHYLFITVPDLLVQTDVAILFIEGGNNKNPPSATREYVAMTIQLAVSTGAIACNLQMVPNQPIVFKDDASQTPRTEDAIIAWTWKKFIDSNGSDPEILLRMPMTKAAVRAMDTVANFTGNHLNSAVNRFVVAGQSKRGWTTWTTAAVDKRVVGFVPIVEDLLNMVKNLHHMWRSYGGWTIAFNDYYAVNFTKEIDSPSVQKLADIVDPIVYNDRYQGIPKMIISASGDVFFPIDDSYYYFDQLKGPKYLRLLPNSEHNLHGHEDTRFLALRELFLSVTMNKTLPHMTWVKKLTTNGGYIRVTTDTHPVAVTCYYANTLDNNRRDFRLLINDPTTNKPMPNPVIWYEKAVENMGNNTYMAKFNAPSHSWLAFFIKVTFGGLQNEIFELTTEALILPDYFPFADCHGVGCKGQLV